MEVEELIAWTLRNDSVVNALVSGRVYPLIVPQDATRPAIAYQRISGARTYSHDMESSAFVRIQLTCEGTTYSEAVSVASAVRDALERIGWRCANELDGWAEIAEAPVRRLDFVSVVGSNDG